MKSGLYLSENKDSTDSPRGLYLSKEKTSSTQNNAIRLGGALYSQDPRENYKGLDVPAGHSALFRAMDGQDRFYAEIMRKQQEEKQASLKQALNQAAQKAMTELNMIKNNHLTVFNSKVKDEISIKILDPFVFELLKNNPIVDLSHYSLNVLKHIRESYKLKDSINIENIIKDNLGYLLTDYREVYNNISDPFKAVISDLFKAGSQIEIDSIKNAFLQNSNHLNDYFEYSEDNNNQSPIIEIICKESLLKVIEDIGLKLENLNKAKIEQNEQEYLSRIEASNEEEKEPHEDDSIDNSFHFSQNPSVRSEPVLSEFEIVPMTELERALAKIKQLEEANATKDLEITRLNQNLRANHDMVNKEEVEQIINQNRETIQKMAEDLTEIRQENVEKDKVIVEKDTTNRIINTQYTALENQFNMLKDEHYEAKETIKDLRNDKFKLNIDKNKLNDKVEKLEEEIFEWKLSIKAKDEELIKLQNADQLNKIDYLMKDVSSSKSVHSSWSDLGKNSLKSIGVSSSKSSYNKAKFKKMEEDNKALKDIVIELNQKLELKNLLPEHIDVKFNDFEEMNNIGLAGEHANHD